MRCCLPIATIALLAGCGREPVPSPTAEQIAAVATQKAGGNASRTGAQPEGAAANRVGPDRMSQAMNCVVHIGQITTPANERAALDRASAAWRAALVRETNEQEAAQLIGSSVNMLADTPAAERQAAVGWCVANAPA